VPSTGAGRAISVVVIVLGAVATSSCRSTSETSAVAATTVPVHPPATSAPSERPIETLAGLPAIPVAGATAEVHDPAIAKEGDTFYLFFTHGGIRVRTSTDLVQWETAPDAIHPFPDWALEYTGGKEDMWAPDVSWWGGRWHLYYAVSTYASRHSAIGHATSPTLDPSKPGFGWVDHGPVVTSDPPVDASDTGGWNAIDASVVLDDADAPWMAWGSASEGIFLQRLRPDGTLDPSVAPRNIAKREAHVFVVEAPTIIRRGDWWYLFASYDLCCLGTKSNYNVRVGRSRTIDGPYVDREGRALTDGGGTKVIAGHGSVYGPGHQAVLREADTWWLVHHWYDATRDGVSDLSIRPVDWFDDWPVARGWSDSIPVPPPIGSVNP
jgi:arabinan endo-1,5-alpha-L-arabinosidase